jgi:5'-3' exonuclease
MGIAGYLRGILRKTKKTHSPDGPKLINVFLMDYNGIVYKILNSMDMKYNPAKKKDYEKVLIKKIIEYTQHLICKEVKPTDLLYIAVDGPAPRAKMVQQRSRRYKSIQLEELASNMKKKYKIEHEPKFIGSINMAPGTEFMMNLMKKLKKACKDGIFSKHLKKDNKSFEIIFNGGDIPGEAEHKFMPLIRKMRKLKKHRDDTICIYSGDGDLIELSLINNKNHIYIFQEVDSKIRKLDNKYEIRDYIYIDIDAVKQAFYKNLTYQIGLNNKQPNIERFAIDYTLLLSFGGNDFIHAYPFTRVRNQGIDDMIIPLYQRNFRKFGKYLVEIRKDGIKINTLFLRYIFSEMAKREKKFMYNYQKNLDKVRAGYLSQRNIDGEADKSPYEIEETRLSHLSMYSCHHPLFKEYSEEFTKIDYCLDPEIWKKQYYQYYFNIDLDADDSGELLRNVVINYLESILYVLNYYLIDCPSWSWYYHYRVPPMPSTILEVLGNDLSVINSLEFTKGNPYTPFEQLMFILPPQMKEILPDCVGNIMVDEKKLCIPYYPLKFRVDAAFGEKYIYSEALLPEFDDNLLLETVMPVEKELEGPDKKRNTIKSKPTRYGSKKK